MCSLSLASDAKIFVRWIPSERNCADHPSRGLGLSGGIRAPPGLSRHGVGVSGTAAPGGRHCRSSHSAEGSKSDDPGNHNRHPRRKPVPVRTQQSQESFNSGTLPQRSPDLLPVVPTLFPHYPGLGCASHGLPERIACAGGKRKRRGVRVRRFQAQAPAIRKVRQPVSAPGHSGIGRLPEPYSGEDEASYTSGGFHGDRRRYAGKASGYHGNRVAPPVGPLAETGRAHHPDPSTTDSAGGRSRHAALGRDFGSLRKLRRSYKDQPVRRRALTQSKSRVPDGGDTAVKTAKSVVPGFVPIHLRSAAGGVQSCSAAGRRLSLGSDAVWESTRWRQRPSTARGEFGRHQEKRTLDHGFQPPSLRKSHARSTAVSQSSPANQAVWCLRGGEVAGHTCFVGKSCGLTELRGSDRHQPTLQASPGCELNRAIKRHLKARFRAACHEASIHRRQVFLVIFAGAQIISKHLRRSGFGVVVLDPRRCPLEDVSHPAVLQALHGWISSGAVLGVWLGTLCLYRTPSQKIHLQVGQCHGDDPCVKNRLRTAHDDHPIMRAAVSVLNACVVARVPCCLENARSSSLFRTPDIRRLSLHHACQVFVSDLCQYGSSWQRPTKVVAWFCRSEVPSLLCHPRHGKCCSRSKRRHHEPLGLAPGGVPWCRIAAKYPDKWARAWADVLSVSASENIQLRILRLVGCL